jgi:ribosomal protein S16
MHTCRPHTYPDGTLVYRVGYYDPSPKTDNWRIIGEVDDFGDAMQYVSYLNGGAKPTGPLPRLLKGQRVER